MSITSGAPLPPNIAAPKPAPKPRKPLSYDDILNRQFMGSIYSDVITARTESSATHKRGSAWRVCVPKTTLFLPRCFKHAWMLVDRPHTSTEKSAAIFALQLSFAESRKTRKQARKLKDDQCAKRDTPDAQKPDKVRDLSETLAELAAEKRQPISRPYPYVLRLADITEEDRAKHQR
ncbi:hypothetical protein B0H14DRAFT_2654351 [Mycena olivaceomarginata]|nr:hypothetical protein B0H14DRAFT_2654351 [Mycena olivaceomarginata]